MKYVRRTADAFIESMIVYHCKCKHKTVSFCKCLPMFIIANARGYDSINRYYCCFAIFDNFATKTYSFQSILLNFDINLKTDLLPRSIEIVCLMEMYNVQ